MTTTDWIQAISMLILVVGTGIYAWRTHAIGKATREQADASMKMAKEVRKERIMASRPVIIQKAIIVDETELATEAYCDWLSYFEVYNAGNGPAVEVGITLLNKEETPIYSQRKTLLRATEPPIKFSPSELTGLEKAAFYLVCEYQSIFSHGSQPIWYQT